MVSRMGKYAALAVVLAGLSAGAVEPAVNLFRDDFKEDENWGGFIDWECSMGTVEKLKETTPDGKPVIRITGGPEIYRYQIATETRKLKEGARYRLSALVRTKGLGALDMRQFQLRNSGWWQSGNADIPGDTGGKWQRISWEGELFPSRDQRYHGMICFSGRFPAGAYCDFAEPRLEGPAGDDFDVWKQESWPGRITPIDPLLSDVCAEAAKLTFYFPGRREDATERRILRATAGGRAVTAALGEDGRATVDFGALPAGRFLLKVEIVGEKSGRVFVANEYRAIARATVRNPTPLRRLNNFVSEVLAEPDAEGRLEFTLAKAGWVYIGFDRSLKNVRAMVDGATVISPRSDGLLPETMRYLPAGRHELKAEGGRPSVRLVRTIYLGGMRKMWKLKPNFFDATFGEDFYRAFGLLQGYNTLQVHGEPWNYPFTKSPEFQRLSRDFADRGVEITYSFGLGGEHPIRNDYDAFMKMVTNDLHYVANDPLEYDESAIVARDSGFAKRRMADAWWQVYADGRRLSSFFDDAPMYGVYVAPAVDTAEISAMVNSGDGRGLLMMESYWRTPQCEAEFPLAVEHVRRQLRSVRRRVPPAAGHVLYALNSWWTIGGWTTCLYPDCHFAAFNSAIVRIIATDPEFAEIGGLGMPTPFCSDEYFRFTMDMIRYYCIEGGTGDFAALNGMKMYPGHVVNGDFLDKLNGWTVEAAEKDSIQYDLVYAYGLYWQHRQEPPKFLHYRKLWPGDTCAVFRRSAKAPNRLRQTLKGLTPGKLYKITFATSDYDQVRKEIAKELPKIVPEEPTHFGVTIASGGKELPELRHIIYDQGKYGRGRVVSNRYVFRATASEAEIVFSDWDDDRTPGGEIGRRRLVNYIGVYPFYLKDESQLETLKKFMLKAKELK